MSYVLYLLYPLLLFFPSKSVRLDIAKLWFLGLIVTGFFLFMAPFSLPGGGNHFPLYADAIAKGLTLQPHYAQRDAGFPLLLLLTGYSLVGSFIGVALLHALFATLMPILIYRAIYQFSRVAAFYAALIGILSLAPIYYMKWIHHDQTFIFFSLLMITLLLIYLQRRDKRYLFLFTVAAIWASLSRPAGNLLFPIFLAIAFFTEGTKLLERKKVLLYSVNLLAFLVVAAGYNWHRYELFDMRRQASIPSYTGQQVFYGVYVNSVEFGVTLSPELGPNLAKITESVRRAIQPSPSDSNFIKQMYPSDAAARFASENIYPFSADELINRTFEIPSWEYYAIMISAEPDDQVFLKATLEIAKAYPLYVLRYTLRNVMVFVFDPGWAHSRYNLNRFHRIGLEFPPDFGRQQGVWETTGLHSRSVREVHFDPWPRTPDGARWLYREIAAQWQSGYRYLVNSTSVLMVISSIGALVSFLGFLAQSSPLGRLAQKYVPAGFAPSVFAVSVLFLFNAAVTGAFAEPDFRYHHFALPVRILLAGLGAALTIRLVCQITMLQTVGRGLDQTARSFLPAPGEKISPRASVWPMMAALTIIVFGTWAAFVAANTVQP